MDSRFPLPVLSELSAEQQAVVDSILSRRPSIDGPFLPWLHRLGLASAAERLGAESMGLKRESFGAAPAAKIGEPTQHHIAATRQLMQQVNATGFPTLFLQHNGSRINIDHQRHYQSPECFVAAVLQAEQ